MGPVNVADVGIGVRRDSKRVGLGDRDGNVLYRGPRPSAFRIFVLK
jgi:hypothetical protein